MRRASTVASSLVMRTIAAANCTAAIGGEASSAVVRGRLFQASLSRSVAISSSYWRWFPLCSSSSSRRGAVLCFVGTLASVAGAGLFFEEVHAKELTPPALLPREVVLYQYEACPFCNKVKDILVMKLLLQFWTVYGSLELWIDNVKFYMRYCLALESIVKHKNNLRNMWESEQWKRTKYGQMNDDHATKVRDIILQLTEEGRKFWTKANDVLKVQEPLVKVLRLVDGDEKPTMGFLYEAMERAKLAIKNNCRYWGCYWKIIDNRWNFQLHHDLHAAGYFLNPQFAYGIHGNDIREDREVMRGLKKVIQRLEPNIDNQIQAFNELDIYSLKQQDFSDTTAQRAIKFTNPAFLDYYHILYEVVEVNPLSKQQIKWSDYKKVPILMVDGESLVDSSVIIDQLYKKICPTRSAGDDDNEEYQWRKWVDNHLVHVLSPNIYRNTSEALEAFDYITKNGNFNYTQRFTVKYAGAAAMYFISKNLKKKYNITDERAALYEAAETWVKALNGRDFLGGSKPNLADLAVFGVLRPIRYLQAGRDMVEHTRIGEWYSRMEKAVGNSARIGSACPD